MSCRFKPSPALVLAGSVSRGCSTLCLRRSPRFLPQPCACVASPIPASHPGCCCITSPAFPPQIRGKVSAVIDGLLVLFWLIAAAVATSILTVDDWSGSRINSSVAFCWITL